MFCFILLPGEKKEKKSKGVSAWEGIRDRRGQLKPSCGEERDGNTSEAISGRAASHGLQQGQSAAAKRRSLKLAYHKRRSHNKTSGASPVIFPFILREEPPTLCSIPLILPVNWTMCAFKYTARERKEMPRVMLTHLRVPRALKNTTGLQLCKSQGTVRKITDFRDAHFSSLWCPFLFENGNSPWFLMFFVFISQT